MRGVHANPFLREAEEGLLLGVVEREGFEAAEDDRVCLRGRKVLVSR